MSFNNFSLIDKLQTARIKTSNNFRINSEFSFKDKERQKFESFNKSKMNQTTGNFHIKLKVNKSYEGLQNIADKFNSLKSSYQNLDRISKSKLENDCKKEEEIDKLNDYIQQCIQTNDQLKYEIQSEQKERSELEKEQRSIADYCNELKRKFANIEKTIEEYEIIVNRHLKENSELQEEYDRNIDEVENENKKFLERLEFQMRILQKQKENIREIQIKSDIELREIADQKNLFMERQMINNIKYDELEKKYVAMQKKLFEFEMCDSVKKAEMISASRKANKKSNQNDNVENQIEEYEMKNKILINNIKDLNNKIQISEKQLNEYSKNDVNFKLEINTPVKRSSSMRK